jgi:hypothetical protein
MMDQRRRKHSLFKEDDIPIQVNVNKETHVALAARLGTVLSMVNTAHKNR